VKAEIRYSERFFGSSIMHLTEATFWCTESFIWKQT